MKNKLAGAICSLVLLTFLYGCDVIKDIPPVEAPPSKEETVDEEEEQETSEEEKNDNLSDEKPDENTHEEEDDIPEEAVNDTPLKHFLIMAGEHYSSKEIVTLNTEELHFQAMFDSSAIYATPLKEDQADINKLLGMSDCKTLHHTNSARIGWRWYEESLQILAYTYVNGERQSSFITTVALNEIYDYSILMEEDRYVFKVGEHEVEMQRGCSGAANGYMLYPYFGGNNAAPHDVSIWINLDQNLAK